MNLPSTIETLIQAQNQFDSTGFSNCFTETAVVFDEGKTHNGRQQIQEWNAKTNKEYNTVLEPLGFREEGAKSILTTKGSGTFPGSPIVFHYEFELTDGLIQSLKITG